MLNLLLCGLLSAAPADSLGMIEKLRSEVFRLRLENRTLRERLDELDRRTSDGSLSSLGVPAARQRSADVETDLYSLADHWDDLTNRKVVVRENRRTGVGAVDTVLCLPQTNITDKYIDIYTVQRKSAMIRIMSRYDGYREMILKVFRDYGIPEEFSLLCVVESACNPYAESPAGALGLWQLMPDTARDYGLRVSGRLDERMDAAKSTLAAAKYLAAAYAEFGSWDRALMSYNCGVGTIRRALEKTGMDASWQELSQALPKETRDYLPALVAAMYVNANRSLILD